jgi:hypothetical protein
VLYPDQAFGEPIWVIDPVRFMIISVPAGIMFLLGAIAVLGNRIPKEQQVAGAPGFEPGIPSSEGWCLIQTRLRAPDSLDLLDS